MICSLKNIIKASKARGVYLIAASMASFMLKTGVLAQDIHFSQFYTTPIFTNPANTGMSGENLRIANNYRNQWSRIGVPYKTLYTSVDKKLTIADRSFGIGGFLVHDQSSAYRLKTDGFFLSLSYSEMIDNNQVTFGIQPGIAFKSYDLNALTFGSQFDESTSLFNSGLSSSEDALVSNIHYFDMNVGIFWRTLIRDIMPSAGLSFSHILTPVVSFSSSSNSRLPVKVTFNSQVIIPVSSRWDVTPGVLYSSTSGTSELLVGGTGGYAINNFFIPVKKIYGIAMLRVNPFSDFDAAIIGCGIKFVKFDLGISYDINVSPLVNTVTSNGAFEISLVFTGISQRKNVNEPCYIY
jgi:type IX secretion system PorP/SprF family membrane protein